MRIITWLAGIAVASASSFGVGISMNPNLEQRTEALEERIAKLEGEQNPSEVPAEIIAHAFTVVNEEGERIGGISANPDGGFLFLYGDNPAVHLQGKAPTILMEDAVGNSIFYNPGMGIRLSGREGDHAAMTSESISCSTDEEGLTIIGAGTLRMHHGYSRLDMRADSEGAHLGVMTGLAGISMQTAARKTSLGFDISFPALQLLDYAGKECVTLGRILDSDLGFIAVHDRSGKPVQVISAKE